MSSDGGHGFHARLSGFQIHQDTVDNHDGIIHQHPHGEDERTERNTLQCAVHGLQEEEGAKHGNHQAITDDESALEAHGNHEDCNHDEYRFHQVDGEGAKGIAYSFGLVEYLVNFQAGREAVGF